MAPVSVRIGTRAVLTWFLAHMGAAVHPAAAQRVAGLAPGVRDFVAVDAPVVALVGVRVIDGTGAPTREDQTVVIRDGLIEAVGLRSEIKIPNGATLLDLRAHTIVPGIVGMHNHLGFGWDFNPVQDARLYLGAGVTTIRTTGTYEPYREINLKRDIDEGRLPGPRIHLTSPYVTGVGSQHRMTQISSPAQARRFVDYWADEGMRWIKVYTRLPARELEAVIQQAHARGLRVTGHLCAVTARDAAALGIDNIEHGLSSRDFDPAKPGDVCPTTGGRVTPPDDAVQATVLALVRRGVALTATLPEVEAYEPLRLAADPRVFDFVSPRTAAAYRDQRTQYDAQRPTLGLAQAFVRSYASAGGLVVAGIDPVYPALLPGFADQRNYELLLEAGFAPEAAVRILSLNGASLLGVDSLFGSIEPGKVADLVVIKGDPTTQPKAIRDVVWVFKDGVGYDSTKLLTSVRNELSRRN